MRCKPGDRALVTKSIDGLAVGKVVEVCSYRGEHSQYGPIWRVRSLGGPLVTEYGAAGITCDMADDWLQPEPPVGGQAEAERTKVAA